MASHLTTALPEQADERRRRHSSLIADAVVGAPDLTGRTALTPDLPA
ncbi:hypothetical protein [Tsukamurella asaccharolytica]|nr:hypothetical protein [Tsukamurella asaccharolytica]